MKTCEFCGSPGEDVAPACLKCGAKFPALAYTPTPPPATTPAPTPAPMAVPAPADSAANSWTQPRPEARSEQPLPPKDAPADASPAGRTELAKQANSLFATIAAVNWALLRYGAENSMGSLLKGTPPDERKAAEALTLACVAGLIGGAWALVRYVGIGRGRTGWILGVIVLWSFLTGMSLVSSQYSRFNGIDWAGEVANLLQIAWMIAIYKAASRT